MEGLLSVVNGVATAVFGPRLDLAVRGMGRWGSWVVCKRLRTQALPEYLDGYLLLHALVNKDLGVTSDAQWISGLRARLVKVDIK